MFNRSFAIFSLQGLTVWNCMSPFWSTVCILFRFQLWTVWKCICTAAQFAVALPTVSSLISLSLCLYAFLCVQLAKQAHRLKPFIHLHSLQLLSWQPCMTDRQQNALSEIQSAWKIQSMNTIWWVDEDLCYGDTRETTIWKVSSLKAGLAELMFTFYVITHGPQD